jgi:two-component SAPR family response regulator
LRTGEGTLAGRRILVVEDDFNIANAISMAFKANGAEIIGPVGNVRDALALVDNPGQIDGAVLDVKLRDEFIYPVAEALRVKNVSMVFTTGYDETSLAPAFADIPCLQKPVTIGRLTRALFG